MPNKFLGPEDFNIKSYADLKSFTRKQWAQQIETRLLYQSFIDMAKAAVQQSKNPEHPLYIMVGEQLRTFFKNPLVPSGYSRLEMFFGKEHCMQAVTPIQAISILALQRAILEVSGVDEKKIHSEVQDYLYFKTLDRNSERDVDDLIKESKRYKIRNLARVQIDLRMTDKKIKHDFDNLLKKYRKTLKIPQAKATEKKLLQWYVNCVLPYADLMLWSRWSPNAITQSDIMDLILSPTKLQSEDPLKSTLRDYKIAMSYDTIVLLSEN